MTKIKMKRKNVYVLKRGHDVCKLKGKKFTSAISKNKRTLDQEVEDMEKFKLPGEDFKKFQEELEEIRLRHTKKDGNGKPVIINRPGPMGRPQQAYDISGAEDVKSPFRKDVSKCEKKYEQAIKTQENLHKKFNEEFLEDEVDMDLLEVDYVEDVPDDITQDEMDGIFDIIINTPK